MRPFEEIDYLDLLKFISRWQYHDCLRLNGKPLCDLEIDKKTKLKILDNLHNNFTFWVDIKRYCCYSHLERYFEVYGYEYDPKHDNFDTILDIKKLDKERTELRDEIAKIEEEEKNKKDRALMLKYLQDMNAKLDILLKVAEKKEIDKVLEPLPYGVDDIVKSYLG